MDTTEAVLAWLRAQFPDARIALVRDRGTVERGTQGFTIRHGASHRVLEVSEEFLEDLDPDDVWSELEHFQVAAVLAEQPTAIVIVTTIGLRFKED